MKKNILIKNEYVGPEISVIDMAVESGFAASGTGDTQELYDDPATIGWGN